jgi:hypothetical protein
MLPFTPDVVRLIEKGVDVYAYLADTKRRHLAAGAESGRAVSGLYDYLAGIYGDSEILTGPDGPFPIAVTAPLSATAVSDPETLTGAIVPAPAHRPVMERQLIPALERRGGALWNGRTFSLSGLTLDDQGAIESVDAYLGYYFDQICSAGYLEYELLAAAERTRMRSIPTLPGRRGILEEYPAPRDCLRAGGGVDATLAISTLTVYQRDGRYWMLCEVRSDRVAEYGALYHVAPSFIFQPVVTPSRENLRTEWSVRHNIFREYLEELFNVEEVELSNNAIDATYFYDHPNLEYLRRLLSSGDATLQGVTLAFNLLNHRPEICTVLVIEDPDWYRIQRRASGTAGGLRHLALNNEFRGAEHNAPNQLEKVTTRPLDDESWAGIARPWTMVPTGAPALILGAKAACERLGRPEPAWLAPFHLAPPGTYRQF